MKSGMQDLLGDFISLSMCFFLQKLISVKFSDKQARGEGEEKNAAVYLKVPVKLKRQSIKLLSQKRINIPLLSIIWVRS